MYVSLISDRLFICVRDFAVDTETALAQLKMSHKSDLTTRLKTNTYMYT